MLHMSIERPASGVPTLPRPREALLHEMATIAALIGGPVDHQPELRHSMLAGTLLMPEAGLLIAGTSCHRPLCFSEARDLTHITGLDVLMLRFDAYRLSYDIFSQRERMGLFHYLRWQRGGDPWFVPPPSGPFVRATRQGLEIGHVAPFAGSADRQAGLVDQLEFALNWSA